MTKAEKNYYIDIALLLIGVVCILTGFALAFKPAFLTTILPVFRMKSLHEWTGYLLTVLIVLHLLLHFDWMKSMTNLIKTTKAKWLIALSIIAISIGLCIAAAVLPSPKTPPGQQNRGAAGITDSAGPPSRSK